MTQARTAAFAANAAAREVSGAAREAAHAAGQAAAVPMLPLTTWAQPRTRSGLCVRRRVRIKRDEAGRLECEWQRAQLPDDIRELVLDDQRLRHEVCCSVFDC
jgi:hypothetical protein